MNRRMRRGAKSVAAVVLLAALVAPTVLASGNAEADASAEGYRPLRVAVMPYILCASVNYADEQGWFEDEGMDLEFIMFPQGAAMNEALGAGLWDVAVTGGAAIFGAANFDAKFICDYQDGTGGNEIHVREDSPIAQVSGANPEFPNHLGSAETVNGSTLLFTAGTTLQMLAVKYLESFGLTDSDVSMVHMEVPQVWQAFKADQGDLASMPSPFSGESLAAGNVRAATLRSLGFRLLECAIAAPKAYEEMKDELAMFIAILIRANEAFEDDGMEFEGVKAWYVKNGREVSDEQIQAECELKRFITRDDIAEIEYGAYQREYAEFLVSVDKLSQEQIDTVMENTKRDVLDMALAIMEERGW